MSAMSAGRWTIGAVGLLVGLYGAWVLWERQEPEQLVTVGKWWVAGVLLHDVAATAVVLLVGWLVTHLVPHVARTPVVVGSVVLATVTVVAVPVLLAYGRKADNPTVLDRHYWIGWCVLAALVLVAVAAATVLRARRGGRPEHAD